MLPYLYLTFLCSRFFYLSPGEHSSNQWRKRGGTYRCVWCHLSLIFLVEVRSTRCAVFPFPLAPFCAAAVALLRLRDEFRQLRECHCLWRFEDAPPSSLAGHAGHLFHSLASLHAAAAALLLFRHGCRLDARVTVLLSPSVHLFCLYSPISLGASPMKTFAEPSSYFPISHTSSP